MIEPGLHISYSTPVVDGPGTLDPVQQSVLRNEASACLAGPFFARTPVHAPQSGEEKAVRMFAGTHKTKVVRK